MEVKEEFVMSLREVSKHTRFPRFSEPEIVGCYSLDSNRKYIEGPEYLKFCKKIVNTRGGIDVKFDLDQKCTPSSIEDVAITQTNERSTENSQMKHIRHWINTHKDLFVQRRPDFVMRRGVILKILGIPYESREDLILAAMYKNGTIYLRKILLFSTTAEWAKYNSNDRHKRCTSWGFNFEHFLLTDDPEDVPDPANHRKGECNVVFRAELNQHAILYAAELDGIWTDEEGKLNPKKNPSDLSKCQLAELKTTRKFPDGRMTTSFRRFTTRKWWCQAFLGKVSDILVGFRNDGGVVEKLNVMQVDTLSRQAVDWSPSVCFNFLNQFLDNVKRIVKENEESVYVFRYEPRRQTNRDCKISVTVERNSSKLLSDLV